MQKKKGWFPPATQDDLLTSIETTRSKLSFSFSKSYSATSPVMTWRLLSPFSRAWASMYSFWVREFEKAVTWLLGNISAK